MGVFFLWRLFSERAREGALLLELSGEGAKLVFLGDLGPNRGLFGLRGGWGSHFQIYLEVCF